MTYPLILNTYEELIIRCPTATDGDDGVLSYAAIKTFKVKEGMVSRNENYWLVMIKLCAECKLLFLKAINNFNCLLY